MTPADLDDLRTLYRQISRRHSVYEKFAPALERALRELEETPLVVQIPRVRERVPVVKESDPLPNHTALIDCGTHVRVHMPGPFGTRSSDKEKK